MFTSFISLFYSTFCNRQRTIKPQVILSYDILWLNCGEDEEKLILSGLFLKVNQLIDRDGYTGVIACRKKDEPENKRTKCHWRQLTVNEKQSLCCLIIFSLYIFSNWKILILPVKSFSKESRSFEKKKTLWSTLCLLMFKIKFPSLILILWAKKQTVLVHFLVILCFSCPEHD